MNEDFREDLKKACEVMQKGGVILYPTDTIWGIGCDATNPKAVKRVYDIKKRADSKAMLVLVDSTVKVNFYVSDVPAVAWDLIEFATKPLTIPKYVLNTRDFVSSKSRCFFMAFRTADLCFHCTDPSDRRFRRT